MEPRIIFYTREGFESWTMTFHNDSEAIDMFFELERGNSIGLPNRWYAADRIDSDGDIASTVYNGRVIDYTPPVDDTAVAWPECRKCGKLIGQAVATRYANERGYEWEHMECN